MSIIFEPTDLKKLGFCTNLQQFEAKGFPWPIPDEAHEIRNGPVVNEFLFDKLVRGPFRPVAVAQAERTYNCKGQPELSRKLRVRNEIRSLCNQAVYGSSCKPNIPEVVVPEEPRYAAFLEPSEADTEAWNFDLKAKQAEHETWLAKEKADMAARRLAHALRSGMPAA